MAKNTNTDNPGERIAKVIARAGLALAPRGRGLDRGRARRGQRRGDLLAGAQRHRCGPIAVDGKPLPGARAHAAVPLSQAARAGDHPFRPGRPPTIFGALPKNLPRLISVGRLDINTEGLLLLTNDGGLARVLELPATGWLRRYRVRAHGRVGQEALDRLRGGITIDGIRYGPIEATLDREQGANVWLTFAHPRGQEPRGAQGAANRSG